MGVATTGRDRGWLYAGIDEAGYGPVLGPLCVAGAVLRVAGAPGPEPPDLWASLADAVCRTIRETRSGRVAIADSKRLRTTAASQHPLAHLERGVLCALRLAGGTPRCESELLARLGVASSPLPWYGAAPDGELPLSTTADHVDLLATRLGRACRDAGVELLDVQCRALDEADFNARVEDRGNKARVSFGLAMDLARRLWLARATREATHEPRLVVDMQGGRRDYADLLADALPGAVVERIGATDERIVYQVRGAQDLRRLRVSFEVAAESRHLPVALASMTAKLVRELFMRRLNAHWCARVPDLRPTAGYATDGGRWLADLARAGALDARQRRQLVRVV